MATRLTLFRLGGTRSSRGAGGARQICRYFSDDRGRILSEEERAAENVYIQKMEREKMEKMKRKAEKEKEKQDANKKTEGHAS